MCPQRTDAGNLLATCQTLTSNISIMPTVTSQPLFQELCIGKDLSHDVRVASQ